jgi:hypothetical protein
VALDAVALPVGRPRLRQCRRKRSEPAINGERATMQQASAYRDLIVVIAGGNLEHDADRLLAVLDALNPSIVIRSKRSGANATAFGWTKAREREMHDLPEGELGGQLASLMAQSSVVVIDLRADSQEDDAAIVREAERLGLRVVALGE